MFNPTVSAANPEADEANPEAVGKLFLERITTWSSRKCFKTALTRSVSFSSAIFPFNSNVKGPSSMMVSVYKSVKVKEMDVVVGNTNVRFAFPQYLINAMLTGDVARIDFINDLPSTKPLL